MQTEKHSQIETLRAEASKNSITIEHDEGNHTIRMLFTKTFNRKEFEPNDLFEAIEGSMPQGNISSGEIDIKGKTGITATIKSTGNSIWTVIIATSERSAMDIRGVNDATLNSEMTKILKVKRAVENCKKH